jgi:hypothetical protein
MSLDIGRSLARSCNSLNAIQQSHFSKKIVFITLQNPQGPRGSEKMQRLPLIFAQLRKGIVNTSLNSRDT